MRGWSWSAPATEQKVHVIDGVPRGRHHPSDRILGSMTNSNAPSSSNRPSRACRHRPRPTATACRPRMSHTPSRGLQHWNPRGCLWRYEPCRVEDPAQVAVADIAEAHSTRLQCRRREDMRDGTPTFEPGDGIPRHDRARVGAAAPIGPKFPARPPTGTWPRSPPCSAGRHTRRADMRRCGSLRNGPRQRPPASVLRIPKAQSPSPQQRPRSTLCASCLLVCGAFLLILTAHPALGPQSRGRR